MNINGADSAVLPATIGQAKNAGYNNAEIKQMEQKGQIECETCKNRSYQDGSDENVSYKSPTHISPGASAAAVMSHEQEHVSNAYKQASQDGGEVIQASVRLQTATCPECGRTYVSGGETTTQIRYREENPYGRAFKTQDAAGLAGQNVNIET